MTCAACHGAGKRLVHCHLSDEWYYDACLDCVEPSKVLVTERWTKGAAHNCHWFHSSDMQHNISCCDMHEMFVKGQWVHFTREECPKCQKASPPTAVV